MTERLIMAAEFEERLAALCLGGAGSAFPRRLRDRHILYRSVVQSLEQSKKYTEGQLNADLQQWLRDVGTCFDTDHVTLRRYLVDEGYLFRDATGSSYEVNPVGSSHMEFEKEVTTIDSLEVIKAAKARVTDRRREHSLRSQP